MSATGVVILAADDDVGVAIRGLEPGDFVTEGVTAR